jgi:hypothetical protein
MALIDWYLVGFGALWIFGLSLNLAALSFADYERAQTKLRFRDVWSRRGYQIVSNAGLSMFCFGLIGMVHSDWEGLLWGALGVAFAFFTVRAWRS